MRKAFIGLLAGLTVLAFADTSSAGGKRDGQSCHVAKSCRSGFCIRENPTDKFGVCCAPSDCPALNAQCGSIDNGCGAPILCGDCSPGASCVNNQCVPGPTTTSSTTTSTTSTTTSTTSTTTTSTTTTSTTNSTTTTSPTTTTTIPVTTTIDLATTTTTICEYSVCGRPVTCGGGGCLIVETPESGCGLCLATSLCAGQACTVSSDCPPGEHCALHPCCTDVGVCAPLCP